MPLDDVDLKFLKEDLIQRLSTYDRKQTLKGLSNTYRIAQYFQALDRAFELYSARAAKIQSADTAYMLCDALDKTFCDFQPVNSFKRAILKRYSSK